MSMTLPADIAVLNSFDSGDFCDILLHKLLPSANDCRLEARFLPSETLPLRNAAFALTHPVPVTVRSDY
jgi:hypothetical protein